MVPFHGRVLVTDCDNKDDRDAIIASILNHKSSRATVYLMVKDFREIPTIRDKFSSVLPFVLDPTKNIDQTRQLLKFLPHMDHFVNFLGQDLALEFLHRRCDFRIKDVSVTYARTYALDKMLNSRGEGIIFNVAPSDDSKDGVMAVGVAAKKTARESVKKIFPFQSRSSTDEPRLIVNERRESEPEVAGNGFWRFLVSLFFFICPCVNGPRVIIPVQRYPPDFDSRIGESFEQLYKSLAFKYLESIKEVQHAKENGLEKLRIEKDDVMKKDVIRMMSGKKEAGTATSRATQAIAQLNARVKHKAEITRINDEYIRRLDEIYTQRYDAIIDEQINMLIMFWKKIRLT